MEEIKSVWKALNNPTKHVVAIVSSYVGTQLGEYFNDPVGTDASGKTISVLSRLGFNSIYDMESLKTFEARADNEKVIIGHNNSYIKNTREALNDIWKSWYAEKIGIEPKEIFVVSIGPSTTGKAESKEVYSFVDVSLTTSDLAAMFKHACVSKYTARKVWAELPDEIYDSFPDIDCEVVQSDGIV
jgi:NADP-reducing hydrogenase subunit HndD